MNILASIDWHVVYFVSLYIFFLLFRQETRTVTSSLTSSRRVLKFLRPHYRVLQAYYGVIEDSSLQVKFHVVKFLLIYVSSSLTHVYFFFFLCAETPSRYTFCFGLDNVP